MTREELTALARRLYEQMPVPKPAWDQLGEATQSVWRDYVIAGRRPVPEPD